MTSYGDPVGPLPDPATFVVTGGAAFRADLEALESARVALEAAASLAGTLRDDLEWARSAVWRGACAASPRAAVFDAQAADLVRDAGSMGLDVREAALRVAAAASDYRTAEGRIAAAAGAHQVMVRGFVWGLVPPGVWQFAGGSPGRDGALFLRTGLLAASAVPALVPWVPAGKPDDRISVTRTRLAPGREDASTFDYAGRSLQQVQGSAALEDGSRVPPSSVLVERIPRADGSTAVMVTVPGTQTWSLDDPSGGVFDTEGNLDAMAGRDSHARQLIERALADQELRPGDAVVFNAHSQGSLHVFGLLEDPGFRARYPVAAVTVLGGVPTAFKVPDDVAVLSVANRDDVVPGLSGRFPVPRPNVVDVRTPSHADIGTAGPLPAVVNAHSLDRYAADARALDTSDDPSVRGYASVLAAAVGTGIVGAGASAQRERLVYTGRDTTTPFSGRAPSSSSDPQPSPSAPRQSRR